MKDEKQVVGFFTVFMVSSSGMYAEEIASHIEAEDDVGMKANFHTMECTAKANAIQVGCNQYLVSNGVVYCVHANGNKTLKITGELAKNIRRFITRKYTVKQPALA